MVEHKLWQKIISTVLCYSDSGGCSDDGGTGQKNFALHLLKYTGVNLVY